MIKKFIFSLLALGTLALQNCDTSTPEPEPDPITAPSVDLPAVQGVDGIFLVMSTLTKNGTTETFTGTAHAVFYQNQSSKTPVDGGTVKINSMQTTKSDNNIYFFSPNTANPNGLVIGSQINWQVTGNTANGVSAINNNDGNGLPNFPSLSEFVIFDNNLDKTIDWGSSSKGDSVIFMVKGPSGTFKRVVPSSVSSITVPKAEIAKLGVGGASVTIINYNVINNSFGGKPYAFIKQSIAFTGKASIQ